eukprot:9503893-Pyramimonas_sp.AAC.2
MFQQLHGYFQCTDAGPDEVAAGKLLGTILLPHSKILHHRGNCLKHQGHLGVKGGMEGLDETLKELDIKWKYFSTLDSYTFKGQGCRREGGIWSRWSIEKL